MSELTKLEQYIVDNCTRIDADQRYRDMLDECYDLSKVGGLIGNMLPSRIIEECDPIAYCCGFNDWVDSEDVCEIGGDYYEQDEADKAKEEFIEELERELESEEETLEDEEASREDKEDAQREISRLKAEIDEANKYEFSK